MPASEVFKLSAGLGASLVAESSSDPATSRRLGRGLDGILGDAFVADADSGLLELLGGHHREPALQLRQFVADTAVAAIAAKFEARAVCLVGVDSSSAADLVATYLPAGWSHGSPASYEIIGRLWQSLSVTAGAVQASIAGEQVAICSQRLGETAFAVAAIRSEVFDSDEQHTLNRFLRSVSVAIGGVRPELAGLDVEVSVQHGGRSTSAEVEISLGGHRRQARCEASSAALATALAAAQLCDVDCTVAYAGQVSLQEHTVNMVVVLDESEAPLIGLSVLPISDPAGPAKAVFSSLVSVSGQPFAREFAAARPQSAMPRNVTAVD